ncbi:hypothetical protein Anapl_06442 [Anas platyrhynchos]|uniref:Uncharacterized protein n=1 Tax=Anas platyrhynchos TaxID=8839 RepID=R0LRR3_ANAPL|nr:hypothetical protein Anapl_06442 [Anas platyrhynchos]
MKTAKSEGNAALHLGNEVRGLQYTAMARSGGQNRLHARPFILRLQNNQRQIVFLQPLVSTAAKAISSRSWLVRALCFTEPLTTASAHLHHRCLVFTFEGLHISHVAAFGRVKLAFGDTVFELEVVAWFLPWQQEVEYPSTGKSMHAEFRGRIFKVRVQSMASSSEEGVTGCNNQLNLSMETQNCQQAQKRN